MPQFVIVFSLIWVCFSKFQISSFSLGPGLKKKIVQKKKKKGKKEKRESVSIWNKKSKKKRSKIRAYIYIFWVALRFCIKIHIAQPKKKKSVNFWKDSILLPCWNFIILSFNLVLISNLSLNSLLFSISINSLAGFCSLELSLIPYYFLIV